MSPMTPREQSEVSLSILQNLETLAVNDPESHRVVLREIVAQARQLNERGYVSALCPVLADTLKAVEIGPWICRIREKIATGDQNNALAMLGELEDWLSRLWRVADPFSDRTEPAAPGTKASRLHKGLNTADRQFLKLVGVSIKKQKRRNQAGPQGEIT